MKPSLQLRIGQSLTMTPQLQQAIRLLQLSSIELQAEVQDALESNMMLEVDDGEHEQAHSESGNTSAKNEESKPEQDTNSEQITDINQENIPDELPVDSGWDDVYDSGINYSKGSADNNGYEGLENLDTKEKNITRTSGMAT